MTLTRNKSLILVIRMDKYLANQNCTNTYRGCDSACAECNACKRESRSWSECWRKCDQCNRCAAAEYRENKYADPYYYQAPWVHRTLATTPLSKQFCDNVCGVNMCNAYRDRYNGYMQCKRCEMQSKCWSPYQQRCVECPPDSSPGRCEMKWGCPNPNGSQFGHRPPIDPMFTDCKPCWNPLNYNT